MFVKHDTLVQQSKHIVNVTLDGVAFGGDAIAFQVFLYVHDPQRMVFIGAFLKNVPYQRELNFCPDFLLPCFFSSGMENPPGKCISKSCRIKDNLMIGIYSAFITL